MSVSAQEQDRSEHQGLNEGPESNSSRSDPEFQQQLSVVFDKYITIKDALVSSDVQSTQESGGELSKALEQVDITLLSGTDRNTWMDLLGKMNNALENLTSTSDLASQRSSFSDLSDALYQAITTFRVGGIAAYYQHCPMYNNSNGGYWLSKTEEIQNPYFGDMMLTCGAVVEEINSEK